jgi:hypothetical protein
MKPDCAEREALQDEGRRQLQRVLDIANQQIEALRAGDQKELIDLDKTLEISFGDKERALGALRQHLKEHGC